VQFLVLKPKDVRSKKRSMKEDWNFSHRWKLVVAGTAWNPPVCFTLERGNSLFTSKDVEWKLRQERGVFGVEAAGRAVKVEKDEHEERLNFQPSVGSGRCRGSLEPAGVLYTGTRWFSVHVERCGMESETGAWSLWC